MTSVLQRVRKYSKVVLDDCDFGVLDSFKDTVVDCTTDPSSSNFLECISHAALMDQSKCTLSRSLEYAKSRKTDEKSIVSLAVDKATVCFGKRILNSIPGRVSIQVDATLSFDIQGIVGKVHELASMCGEEGINPKQRVLFSIVSTWEGIKAAEILEKEGYKCNMILVMSLVQALTCAQSNVTMISPSVSGVVDYHEKNLGKKFYGKFDPGVCLAKKIYLYIKKYYFDVSVAAASLRAPGQVVELVGCDYLVMPSQLLLELSTIKDHVDQQLILKKPEEIQLEQLIVYNEKSFHSELNRDPCASTKLDEGIALLAKDLENFRKLMGSFFQSPPR